MQRIIVNGTSIDGPYREQTEEEEEEGVGGGLLSFPGRGRDFDGRRREGGQEGGDDGQWELVMEAVFIECRHMLAYANVSSAGGPCQVRFLVVVVVVVETSCGKNPVETFMEISWKFRGMFRVKIYR